MSRRRRPYRVKCGSPLVTDKPSPRLPVACPVAEPLQIDFIYLSLRSCTNLTRYNFHPSSLCLCIKYIKTKLQLVSNLIYHNFRSIQFSCLFFSVKDVVRNNQKTLPLSVPFALNGSESFVHALQAIDCIELLFASDIR